MSRVSTYCTVTSSFFALTCYSSYLRYFTFFFVKHIPISADSYWIPIQRVVSGFQQASENCYRRLLAVSVNWTWLLQQFLVPATNPTTWHSDPHESSTKFFVHYDNLLLWHFDPVTILYCDVLTQSRRIVCLPKKKLTVCHTVTLVFFCPINSAHQVTWHPLWQST
jgi:hypothetical protein